MARVSNATANKWLRHKVISSVKMRSFDDGRGRLAYDPIIYFADGSAIEFVTMETEGNYGTAIVYHKATRSPEEIKP